MSQIGEYPQDAKPVKNRRVLKIVIAAVAAAVAIAALSWGGVAWANGVSAQRAHVEAVATQHQVDAARGHLTAQTQAAGDESDTSSADAVVAAEQAREAAALAAQQAAAAEVAAEAAAHKAAGSHATKCPAGSQANSGDGDVDFTCFPDICFHITLPDPNHPECVTAFKP
jgi:hypothetical protein